MSILKCAVIGVGYLGRFHAQKYAMLPQAELVAVCDNRADIVEKVAEELNVPGFTHYEALFGLVDAVSIAATTRQHYTLAKAFLANGIHVLLEKPMTETVEEADELIHLAKKNNLVLQIGHLERFNPAFCALKNCLETPLFIDAQRLASFNPRGSDVNVIFDLMIHDIDLIQNLVQSPLVHMEAHGTAILTESIDIANVRLHFENLCVANLTASRISYTRERKMRIFQKDAYYSVDFQNNQLALFKKGQSEIIKTENRFEQSDALLRQIESFLDSISHHRPPRVSGTDARNALVTASSLTSLIQINLLNHQVHV